MSTAALAGWIAVLMLAVIYLAARCRRLEARDAAVLGSLGTVLALASGCADQARRAAAGAADAEHVPPEVWTAMVDGLQTVVRTLDELVVFIREVQAAGGSGGAPAS